MDYLSEPSIVDHAADGAHIEVIVKAGIASN